MNTQQNINYGAYIGDPTADTSYAAFEKCQANFTYLFENSGFGGTLTLADGSVFEGIGNGLSVAASPGTLTADFTKVLSTGGGSLTGALTIQTSLSLSSSGSAATVSGGGTLYLEPSAGGSGQVWLGGSAGGGAVYSATIGTTTSNPGTLATNKLWNNGGACCLSTGAATLPNPAFAPTHIASQQWGDISATETIFSHNNGVVPTPPTPLTATFGDIKKLGNVYNFGEVFAPQQTLDAWPTLQNFLLYVQLMRLAQMGGSLDNVAERAFTDVYLPAGDFLVSQPLIVPDGVRLGGPGRLVRVAYTGNQSNNGSTSVLGAFGTGTYAQYLPTVVVVPRGHLSDLNVYVNGSGVFAYRGSGVCMGKNWQAIIGNSVTIGNAGAGYSVGDIFVASCPSQSPYSGFTVGVTSVNGTGGITGGTITLGGAYALPPATYNGGPSLQQQQWQVSNGIEVTLNHNTTPITGQPVFDPSNPGYFTQYGAYRSNFVTASPGVGATILPPWQQDFQTGGGQYMCGSAATNGSQAGRIQITGSVPDLYDDTGVAGPTFNVMLSGLEMEIDSIQGLGGHTGIWATFAQDTRISRFNTVGSNIGFWARGSGSIECANVVLDTCGCILVIDQSHGIRLHGRAFYEEGNIPSNPNGINSQSVPPTGGVNYAMIIGSVSNPTYPVSCLDIKFTVINMGGLPASTIAAYGITGVSPSTQAATCYLSYLYSSTIDLTVSNTSQYGGNVSPLPTSGVFQLGYAVDPGNDLRGSIDTIPTIDGVAPPAQVVTITGGYTFPNCAIKVKDGLHGFWFGDFQTLTYASTVTPNFAQGRKCTLTLTGNVTIGTPVNMVPGGEYAIRIIQDSTGSRTVTWPSAFKWAGGSAGVLSTAANAVDVLTLYSFDGTTAEASLGKAYA